jgi:integrase/recombinase XerD
MTPLRAKYIRDLVIRGRSKHTREAYTRYVRDLARYYRRSPELISYEEVTGWLYHLIKKRQLSASSVNIAVSAVRFLYAVTLGRETLELMASVPHMKRATRRAEVYARSEVEAILTAPRQPRDRVLLMTVYGCGLRISEATQLKTSDIDRARMQLRVRDGKGAKGRVLPLSERLLKELVNYWRAQRQGKAGHNSPWLFLGKKAGQPMSRYAGQNIYYSALKKSGVRYKEVSQATRIGKPVPAPLFPRTRAGRRAARTARCIGRSVGGLRPPDRNPRRGSAPRPILWRVGCPCSAAISIRSFRLNRSTLVVCGIPSIRDHEP